MRKKHGKLLNSLLAKLPQLSLTLFVFVFVFVFCTANLSAEMTDDLVSPNDLDSLLNTQLLGLCRQKTVGRCRDLNKSDKIAGACGSERVFF